MFAALWGPSRFNPLFVEAAILSRGRRDGSHCRGCFNPLFVEAAILSWPVDQGGEENLATFQSSLR